MAIRSVTLATALVLVGAVAAADTVVVQMTTVDFQPTFVPADVTIAPGDVVRWVNVDPFLIDHSTKNGTGRADPLAGTLWNSGILGASEFFEIQFDDVGDFEYFSVPHEFEGMFGVVHVSTSTPAPAPELESWGAIKSFFSLILPRD